MRYVTCFLCLMIIGMTLVANGQQDVLQKKEVYVVAPNEKILVTIVSQPDCPLQIEEAKYLCPIEGGVGRPSYYVRNRGTKPIRSITVGSPLGTWGWSEEFTGKLLMPGERLFDSETDEELEVTPLTKELRNKLKLNGPMTGLVVLMVLRVEYADGSTYDAQSTFDAMVTFLDDLADKAYEAESQRKRKKSQ